VIVLTIVFIIILKSIILVYCFSLVVLVPGRSQVITLKGAIMTVAGGNILDETWRQIMRSRRLQR
jgi:hypothetical protein